MSAPAGEGVFALLGVAVEPARAAAIQAELRALAARLRQHAPVLAFEAEPADFQRAQAETRA